MNNELVLKEKYMIKSSDVDSSKRLKISSLLLILQNLATDGSEIVGAGKDVTLDRGYGWIIAKMELNIKRLPTYREEITLETYPNNRMHFIYPRTFNVYDKDGNLIIEGPSYWTLINLETRKVALYEETGIDVLGSSPTKRIKPIQRKDVSLVEKRVIRYSDLDLNHHFNNTKYFEFIFDTFDSSFNDSKVINHLSIEYSHELHEKDVVEIYKSDDNTYFEFAKDGQKAFNCEIGYEK
ncbi:MAG: hypothetical protein K6G38_00445 [Gammaproteobacteria bacterium]|nr:hypothetical protein [Gammaproteobacteria bacterium]